MLLSDVHVKCIRVRIGVNGRLLRLNEGAEPDLSQSIDRDGDGHTGAA